MALFPSSRVAFNEDNVHLTMRYAYYIGETMRRASEATWVALPPHEERPRILPAIDYPFREGFTVPTSSVKVVVNRRTGTELAQNYRIASRDYTDWLDAGRPERTFLGTLREED